MSSSVEQESRKDSQVAKALEAAKDPFFREIGVRVDSPSQIPKVGEILKFTNQEEKNVKALVWLKKNESTEYEFVLKTSEVDSKKRRKRMKILPGWGKTHKEGIEFIKSILNRVLKKESSQIVYFVTWEGILEDIWDYPNQYDRIRVTEKRRRLLKSRYYQLMWISPNGDKRRFKSPAGFVNLRITVMNKKSLSYAKRFAKIYKEKTGKEVEIYKEY